ncbi:MAG: MFS transporter [Lentisphaerota bacterium]
MSSLLGLILPQKTITDNDTAKGLTALVYDGVFFQTMLVLTSGAFLVAFAVKLGASNLVIGTIAAIGPVCQLLQIPSIFVVDKFRYRKLIVLICAFLSRILWVPLAMLPWFMSPSSAVVVMLILILIMNMLGALAGCSWNSWIRNFVPDNVYGTLFPKRLAYAMGAGAIVSLLAGIGVEKIQIPGLMPTTPYAFCFLLGTIFGLLGIICIAKIPEPHRETTSMQEKGFFKSIVAPFRDYRYRKLIYFMGMWNFAINMAAPFFVVYMMVYLSVDIFTIILLSVINQIANFLFFGIWGRLSDRFSNKSCLAVAGFLFIISIALWTITEKNFLLIPILVAIHILAGISTAGVALCSNNITLKLAPKEEATAYLAACSVIAGIATAIAPILGAFAEIFFKSYEFTVSVKCVHHNSSFYLDLLDYYGLDFVFLISCVLGIYALSLLSKVKETGEKLTRDVYPELMIEIGQGLRSISTVMGLKFLFKPPRNTSVSSDTAVKAPINK